MKNKKQHKIQMQKNIKKVTQTKQLLLRIEGV